MYQLPLNYLSPLKDNNLSTQSVVHRTAAAVSPASLLEMQALRAPYRPPQ